MRDSNEKEANKKILWTSQYTRKIQDLLPCRNQILKHDTQIGD